MSQENVEIAQATFDAWNAKDMDALRELYDPDVLMRTPEGWPEPGPFLGREATMRWFEQSREAFDADALEPISDFIDAADRVVVRFIWHGVGHGPETHGFDRRLHGAEGKNLGPGVLLGSRRCPRNPGTVAARRSDRFLLNNPRHDAVALRELEQRRVVGSTQKSLT
jgi:ketosteroid isomerase-like protein